MDIFETDSHEVVIKAELPGRARGHRPARREQHAHHQRGAQREAVKDEQFHRVERTFGAFSRTFSLPPTVDAGNVEADYKDGILR